MSVAVINCGRAGWITDLHGYCYATIDPETGASVSLGLPAKFLFSGLKRNERPGGLGRRAVMLSYGAARLA